MRIIFHDSSFIEVDTYADLLWHLLRVDQPRPENKSDPGPPPEQTQVTDPPPRVFALIIGINLYTSPDVANLHGAVADADDMERYLTDTLNVPADQIRVLRNGEATRSAIITEFIQLQNDPRIRQDDAILIFYAGHGGETTAPPGWESEGNKTQYILPCDIKTKDNDGNDIHGIADRTLASLLDDLANMKGDNISVFFDCCHSGSGTRTDKVDSTRLARVVELDDNVPSDLDNNLWRHERARGSSLAPGFAQRGLLSHTILAACGARELAQEDNTRRGVFTKALLTTLRTVGADKVTYRDILTRMPALPSQNPQCEGVNQNRILFNARVPSPGRVWYNVSIVDGAYIMEGGAAHGITDGAEFTIYKNQESPIQGSPLGVFVAKKVAAFTTTLTPPSVSHSPISFVGQAYALQTKAGEKEDLRLFVSMNDNLIHVFQALAQQMQHPGSDNRRIQLVESDKNPHFQIDIEGGRVVFKNLDPLVTKYGLVRMPYTTNNNVNDVNAVIRAAAHFRWHIELTNPNHTLKNKVELQFYEIREKEGEYDDFGSPIYTVVGENLNVAGEVYIGEDSSKMYGFRIVNTTRLSLYPSLFYFDNSSFEILPFYQPPFAGQFKLDAPLQPHSSLAIGFGSSGHAPRVFSLPPGQDVDVGFLKLFLTTRYVDYSNIPQPSPFSTGRGTKSAKGKTIETWDTIKIPVIIKKGHVI